MSEKEAQAAGHANGNAVSEKHENGNLQNGNDSIKLDMSGNC